MSEPQEEPTTAQLEQTFPRQHVNEDAKGWACVDFSCTEEMNADPQSLSKFKFMLSNERTVLAWIRTSIVVMGFGIAIAQLTPKSGGAAVGMVCLLFGALLMMWSAHRYLQVQRAAQNGTFRSLGGGIIVIAGVGVTFALVSAVLVLTQHEFI